jgi:Zn-dependent protease with chaperone function
MSVTASVELDVDKQRQAKEYARIRRRLFLVDLAIGGVYTLVWLVFGWSSELKQALMGYTENQWLLVAGFGLVFGGIYFLVNLPLSYYSGYILPHRYDLSNQTLSGWLLDMLKGVLVGGALGLLVLEVIYAVLRAVPQTWWLWAGLILLVLNVILANLTPVLLLPIFYKFKPLSEDHGDLAGRLIRLAERAGTRVRGVYQFDMSRRTKAANAALTGLGNTRRILLGDTLINEFTPDEIETVLAHELGHHVHRDLPFGLLVESVITLGGLYLASVGLSWGVEVFGFESPADIAALPLFALVVGIYGLITMPLSNAFSRWRERRADAYALEATGKGEAYASALTRLANQNLAEAEPEEWVEFLLYSHPALSKRIEFAQHYSLEHG